MSAGNGLRRAWRAAIVLLALAIVAGSLLPAPALPVPGLFDKVEHFLGYFGLALLGAGIVPPERLWIVMARCFALGIALEALQAIATTTRTADWTDLLANTLGILAAWAITAGGRAGWARHVESWLARRRRP